MVGVSDQEVGLTLARAILQPEPCDAVIADVRIWELIAQRLVQLGFCSALYRKHRGWHHPRHQRSVASVGTRRNARLAAFGKGG